MGGDERALLPLLPPDWKLEVFSWPLPHPNESLFHYCQRPEAQALLKCDALLGFSFGALPALALQKLQTELPLLLLACAIHRKEINPWLRLFPFSWLLPLLPAQWTHQLVIFFVKRFGKFGDRFDRFLQKIPPVTYHWALQQSLKARFHLPSNTFRLHGAQDTLFPASRIQSAEWIEQGGHLLLSQQPKAVKQWLHKTLNSLA